MAQNDSSRDFMLREHEAVRNDMDATVKETRTLERYALLATGAIWSWVARYGIATDDLIK